MKRFALDGYMSRKLHTPEFKLRVAVEAAKGHKTAEQIAKEYSVSLAQVEEWKNRLLEDGVRLFERKKPRRSRTEADFLHDEIDKLNLQVNWLRQKLGLPDYK